MNREEAIEHLKNMKMPHDKFYTETTEINRQLIDKGNEALKMGIGALENQKTGHWIIKDDKEQGYDIAGIKTWYIQIMCDKCGFIKTAIEGRTGQYRYCPNCGAKMEGDR